jgi:3-dehydroquinate synthase
MGYGKWLHGEAVGCGMVMATQLSMRLGLVDTAFAGRIEEIVARAKLPTKAPALGADRFVELMRVDKKAEAGEIKFVVIDKPGHASVRGAPDTVVRDVIAHCSAGA